MFAAMEDEPDKSLIERLVNAGADINITDINHMTPLMNCVRSSRLVRIFLSYGADVDVKDDNGVTALMDACFYCAKESVSMLIKAGADVNAVDDDGCTPLILTVMMNYDAVKDGHVMAEIIDMLIQHGADINAETQDGFNALAVLAGNTRVENVEAAVNALVSAGININTER